MSQVFILLSVFLVFWVPVTNQAPQVVGETSFSFSSSTVEDAGEGTGMAHSSASLGYRNPAQFASQGLIHRISGSNVPEDEPEIDAPMYDQHTIDSFISSIRGKNLTVSHELESLGSDYLNKTKTTKVTEASAATTMSPGLF